MIKFALEFLNDSQFKPSAPVSNTYPIMKFVYSNEYCDSILPSLLDYFLVFKDKEYVCLLKCALRRYACTHYWIPGRNETMLNSIVEFIKTIKRRVLIKGLFSEILVLGDEGLKNELICDVFTGQEETKTSLYIELHYGTNDKSWITCFRRENHPH